MAKRAPESPILKALREACHSEEKAVGFLERQRWGDSPACPRCGSVSVYTMRDRYAPEKREWNYRWRCRDCKRMYSVRTGLALEETRLPLRIWVYAFWKASSSKKGVSALQISREYESSYKSALFLMHRIRYAMTTDHSATRKLSGTVEVDEAAMKALHLVGRDVSKESSKRKKRGPEPDRLRIDEPEEALRKLLTTPPPPKEGSGNSERADDAGERDP